MQKISIVMIVKNESEHLERCLESVKDADEIIVCDTGSTDGGATVRIAQRYTPNVFEDYKWNDSFAEARNHAKSKATGDWIFSIDADEFCHDFSKVREAVEEAEKRGILAIDITQVAENTGETNHFPRIFKNKPEVLWHGDAHNYINVLGTLVGDVKITYGYSLTHLTDPNRTLRILEKCYNERRAGAREMYYLAREYFYRKRHAEAVAILNQYINITRFLAEKADAYMMMARCHWAEHEPDLARNACAQAIIINPDFKEALLFMAELSWPRQGKRWRSFAELADNSEVLFKRT